MATSSQTPTAAQASRVLSLHKAPLPKTVFVDRDGDEWTATGHTDGGELLLACPHPHDPQDAGEGESFPWTLHTVQSSFGPLIARSVAA
ncbi:hypothetical protein [Streptomyces sp. NPDC101149]|uniref:hypothetical protein n=1 Tax=Streptomyces sp. NPDC101149 TaxID=3366113 RepID=UPI003810C2FA